MVREKIGYKEVDRNQQRSSQGGSNLYDLRQCKGRGLVHKIAISKRVIAPIKINGGIYMKFRLFYNKKPKLSVNDIDTLVRVCMPLSAPDHERQTCDHLTER